jgi:hypothetical protein
MAEDDDKKKPDIFAHAAFHVAGRQMNEVVAVLNSISCVAHGLRTAAMLANVPVGSELDTLTAQLVQNIEGTTRGILMTLRKIDEEFAKLFPGDGTVDPGKPPTRH